MSKIFINYPCDEHPKEEIKARVIELLQKLEDKYGITHEFTSDDACDLSGTGVTGQVNIDDNGIAIEASLGFMMMAFKGMIESELMTKLDEAFDD